MRPRKRVLIFDPRGDGTIKFVLETRGMGHSLRTQCRVVASPLDFAAHLDAFSPDAVVLFHDGVSEDSHRTCDEAAFGRGVPALVVPRSTRMPAAGFATMTLSPKQGDAEHILEGLRIILLRKRGPQSVKSLDAAYRSAVGFRAAQRNVRLA